jgi:hypothetical protein
MKDFGYVLHDAYHFRMLSGFDWHSDTKMILEATNGEKLLIDNKVLTLQKPGGEVLKLDPTAGRRLNAWGGALMTSGSFTMMAAGAGG